MNVLFPFVGDSVGGSHVATCILIKQLVLNQKYTPVVLLHRKGPLEEYLKKNDIPYEFFDKGEVIKEGNILRQFYGMIKNISSLRKFLRNRKIDIVHTNDLRMHYTWLLPVYNHETKHIWHQHSRTSSWRLGLFAFFTDKVLTISKYCNSGFPAVFRRKSEIVYNPFDVCKKSNEKPIRDKLKLTSQDKIVGFVGNLTQQKRPDFFINLAIKMCSNEGSPHFVLIGEKREPLFSTLHKRVVEAGLQNKIHFMGSYFPIESYIQDMDVLVAPAVNEGLGRTVIEAMFCGTPVVASNHGGHKEVIVDGKTGFLIDPNSDLAFISAIEEVLKNPDLSSSIASEATTCAKDKYSKESYMSRIIGIYDSF